jgi:hypothetical protein
MSSYALNSGLTKKHFLLNPYLSPLPIWVISAAKLHTMVAENEETDETVGAEGAPEGGVNLADAGQVRKRNKKLTARDELRKRFIARLLSDRDGREWMYEKLTSCHIWAPCHVPGDPYSTAFQDGERNAGLRLLADIPPDALALMLTEAPGYDG